MNQTSEKFININSFTSQAILGTVVYAIFNAVRCLLAIGQLGDSIGARAGLIAGYTLDFLGMSVLFIAILAVVRLVFKRNNQPKLVRLNSFGLQSFLAVLVFALYEAIRCVIVMAQVGNSLGMRAGIIAGFGINFVLGSFLIVATIVVVRSVRLLFAK